MATKKKKVRLVLFQILLHRGKITPSLVAVRTANSAEEALEGYLSDNAKHLVPGNAGHLSCGHKSILVRYEAVRV